MLGQGSGCIALSGLQVFAFAALLQSFLQTILPALECLPLHQLDAVPKTDHSRAVLTFEMLRVPLERIEGIDLPQIADSLVGRRVVCHIPLQVILKLNFCQWQRT